MPKHMTDGMHCVYHGELPWCLRNIHWTAGIGVCVCVCVCVCIAKKMSSETCQGVRRQSNANNTSTAESEDRQETSVSSPDQSRRDVIQSGLSFLMKGLSYRLSVPITAKVLSAWESNLDKCPWGTKTVTASCDSFLTFQHSQLQRETDGERRGGGGGGGWYIKKIFVI